MPSSSHASAEPEPELDSLWLCSQLAEIAEQEWYEHQQEIKSEIKDEEWEDEEQWEYVEEESYPQAEPATDVADDGYKTPSIQEGSSTEQELGDDETLLQGLQEEVPTGEVLQEEAVQAGDGEPDEASEEEEPGDDDGQPEDSNDVTKQSPAEVQDDHKPGERPKRSRSRRRRSRRRRRNSSSNSSSQRRKLKCLISIHLFFGFVLFPEVVNKLKFCATHVYFSTLEAIRFLSMAYSAIQKDKKKKRH